MTWLPNLKNRFTALFRRRQLDREMAEEMAAHLDRETEQNLGRGMAPTEARCAARRAFGGVDQLQERERDARGWRWLDDFLRDLRFALRSLRRSPGFTAAAVAILALGIAGNTVVFSLVNGLFLAPLPFPHPEQLVDLDVTAPKWGLHYTGINYADFAAWREHNQTFAGMAHWRGGEFSLASGQRVERVAGQRVTHDLGDVFGLQPALGRMFRADEELHHGAKVALIGDQIWKAWFGSDPNVLGKTVRIDSEDYAIIGVLPPSAVVPVRVAFWIPFDSPPTQWSGMAVGRLKPGVTIEQAGADLLRIHRARIPVAKDNAVTSPLVQPLRQRYLGGTGLVAGFLQCAVAVLLLIAAANVAGLMLARTLVRSRELGLRATLGASRLRLTCQLLTEGLVLATIGGAAGVVLGRWLLGSLIPLLPDLPAWIRLEVDWRLVAFVGGVVVFCALVAGLLPAQRILRRLDGRGVLGPGTQQATPPGPQLFSLRVLVVGEIALALGLLLVAGLLGRAFQRVSAIDSGLRPDHLLTYGLLLPEAKYRDNASQLAFFERHLERLRALPGVVAAGASTALPFSGEHVGNFLEPEGGLPGGPDAQTPVILTRMSFPGYLAAAGIPLQAGRDFDPHDRRYQIIVNETLARLFWPGENAIGKRLRTRGGKGPWLEVVGVARDVRHYGLEADIRPGIYVPFYAMPQSSIGIVVRTRGDPAALGPAVRALLHEQDATLPVAGLATMEDRIRQSLFPRRLYSATAAIFALLAVAMATTGLYGVVAYVVSQRTREFGIRQALGARRSDLLRAVARESARLAAIGMGLGTAGGVLAGRALAGLLRGASPFDPLVLGGAGILLGVLVLLASAVPAFRATRVDPMVALRAE